MASLPARVMGRIAAIKPRTRYFRDVVRPRILSTAPVTNTDDDALEIHVLTSDKDWLNLMWTLKSFYRVSPRRLAMCIHGDPGLSEEAIAGLRAHFPEARVITQAIAREEVLDSLAAYPRCRQLRETNILSIKVFDFLHYLEAERMALFDSDLLFFGEPTAWLAYANDPGRRANVFNPDIASAYAVEEDVIREAGFAIHPEVNSGFGIVHRDSMPLEWIEEFLSIPGLPVGHFWRIEQTLYALCASRFGVELLPEDYRVFLEGELGDRSFRHYVGAVRDKMFTEGMRKLAPSLLMQK
ncbi:hypothetical protein FHS52_003212 [Erythromicrobium ramosum]|uniref:Glycosyl transferase n=1 Tax=Erythrobacter ramosus TaxID=35811 RepID=A0A6I4UM60_9SPHN|nr:hypothetical protein [Erythrobacter ramosus]MBB3777215.1 hypothetical protein [Erythrobacter ramosus]MXP39952.1 hypothetical protein [Erythrobacter ramosus]